VCVYVYVDVCVCVCARVCTDAERHMITAQTFNDAFGHAVFLICLKDNMSRVLPLACISMCVCVCVCVCACVCLCVCVYVYCYYPFFAFYG